MFKVGNDHNGVIVFVNKLSIKKFILSCSLLSIGLSVSKGLQFDINVDMPTYAFPLPFIQNVNRYWIRESAYVAITVLNAISDMLNYFGFLVLQLVVDLVLVLKMRNVLKEKEKKMRDMRMSEAAMEKVLAENKESKRRVVLMVIVSSCFNLLTKVPSMITSLNDVRLIVLKPVSNIYWEWFLTDLRNIHLSFRFFCLSQKGCMLFQQTGNCLFLFSLCFILHFLKNFDMNFKAAYQMAFRKKKKQNKEQIIENKLIS